MDGGAARVAAVAGKGVPQYPQNLLPCGNDLWHLGHMTWGTGAATGARRGGAGGAAARGGAGGAAAAGAPAYCGFPQRAQVVAEAGFMAPQDAHRVYRTVPCSLTSALIGFALLDFTGHHSPAALIQMGLV